MSNYTFIAFYKGVKTENPKAKLFDRLVCFVTGSKYSHVELLVGYNPLTGYADAYSSSGRDGGVRHKTIDVHTPSWDVFMTPCTRTDWEHASWFQSLFGQKYDWLGVLGVVLPFRKMHSEHRWFCSEVVAASLGIQDSHKLTPGKLHRVLNLVSVNKNPRYN